MDKNFICGDKYTISATNTISLSVVLGNLPNEVTINGTKLLLKSSFHVSLVCINEIIKKHSISIPGFIDSLINEFCDFVRENDINVLNYLEDFRFAEEADQKTIVIFCNVSKLKIFFELINKKYNLNIEYPPTHVTLYTLLPGKLGIFLTDADDIKNLTKPISNPIWRTL